MGMAPEQVIAWDEKLYDYVSARVAFEEDAVPEGVLDKWPGRASPGIKGWKSNPLLLCRAETLQILQRTMLTFEHGIDPSIQDMALSLSGWTMGHDIPEHERFLAQRNWLRFISSYKSILIEVVSLCIVAKTYEKKQLQHIFTKRSSFLQGLVRILGEKFEHSARRYLQTQESTSRHLAEVESGFHLYTYEQTSRLIAWWILETEVKHNPRFETALSCRYLPDRIIAASLKCFRTTYLPRSMCQFVWQALCQHPKVFGMNMDRPLLLYHTIFRSLGRKYIPDGFCEGNECRSLPQETKATVIKHRTNCRELTCGLLTWSYDEMFDSRQLLAISAEGTADNRLQVVPCSERTMAVSHVLWREQDASFEDGVPECIHSQLSAIALARGCTSYYLGPMISSEDGIEQSSASNRVFRESEFVLLYDRDLVQISIPSGTIKELEVAIASLLISNWASNPLKLIEAAHAGNAVHILCKDDNLISLATLIWDVVQNGSIDVAILLRSNEFITRYLVMASRPLTTLATMKYEAPDFDQLLSMLSRARYRNHPDWAIGLWNQLVIARGPPKKSCLLGSAPTCERMYAECFWRSQLTNDGANSPGLPARWLISPTPRVATLGLRWAPVSPLHVPLPKAFTDQGWRVYHSGSVERGGRVRATESQLKGVWRTHSFGRPANHPAACIATHTDATLREAQNNRLDEIREQFGQTWFMLGLLQATAADTKNDWEADIPVWGEVGTPDGDGNVKGVKEGRMIAVVGTNNATVWTWLGVYVWDLAVPLPRFERRVVGIV
ncbi:MAG: hypothetical protein LQ340_000322 [Diploschistes diacapsis]|nr:MAG: hypothetical protein LQ340_000322 [Diploschistes diacapsis]